jgi:hypothetical protein
MARTKQVKVPGESPQAVDAQPVPKLRARVREPVPASSTPTNRDPETLTAPVFIEGQGWLCPEPKA